MDEQGFWQRVNFDGPTPANKPSLGPCWIWNGSHNKQGYGSVYLGLKPNGKPLKDSTYAVAYRLLIGTTPRDLEPDHLCFNPRCVNPFHIEYVTHQENMLRGNTVAAIFARRTTCNLGHPLSGRNLYIKRDGSRRCRICDAARHQRIRDARQVQRRDELVARAAGAR